MLSEYLQRKIHENVIDASIASDKAFVKLLKKNRTSKKIIRKFKRAKLNAAY